MLKKFADIAKISINFRSDPHTMYVEYFNDNFEIIKIFHKSLWPELLFTTVLATLQGADTFQKKIFEP